MAEEPNGARRFDFPQVRVLDVEDQTGYLAVESGANMEVDVEAGVTLREIGLEEMVFPRGFRPARGLLAAYEYASHPWSLNFKTVRFEDEAVLAVGKPKVIDFYFSEFGKEDNADIHTVDRLTILARS